MTALGPKALADEILKVDGVASLHGRRLSGLRVDEHAAHVHLALYEGYELATVADTVRRLVARQLGLSTQSVVISVDDLVPQPPTDQETS